MSDLRPFQTPLHARATVLNFLQNRFSTEFRVIDVNSPKPGRGDWRGAACETLISKKRTVVCHDATRHPAAADTVVAALLVSPRAKVGACYAFPFQSDDGSYQATLCGIAMKPATGSKRLDTRLVKILARFLAGMGSAHGKSPRPQGLSGVPSQSNERLQLL
jgi:hypothetical protein